MPDTRFHILVAVLDWGLGHATRCIPIIQSLQKRNYTLSIAGNGSSFVLLKQEFPNLTFYELVSYQVRYPAKGSFLATIFLQLPKFLLAIWKEHRQIEKLVATQKVDYIISDNRYGRYSRKAPSVFITHQLNILLPKPLHAIVNYFNHRLIKNFRVCWVPDDPLLRASGMLSKADAVPVKFIGILSRFRVGVEEEDPQLLVGLISGPEKQRSTFEALLVHEFESWPGKSVIVRGIPKGVSRSTSGITLIDHLSGEELNKLVQQAGIIVARSGYSTIMDLHRLGKKRIVFIPTPGQTEQEYLARDLDRKKIAWMVPQEAFQLSTVIQALQEYTGFEATNSHPNLLEDALDELIHLK